MHDEGRAISGAINVGHRVYQWDHVMSYLHMKHAIPWIVAAMAALGLAVTFLELQRDRGRKVRHPALFREFVIRSDLAEATAPILVIGDSITEGAKLPREIAGRAVINGGIDGATVEDFERMAPALVPGVPAVPGVPGSVPVPWVPVPQVLLTQPRPTPHPWHHSRPWPPWHRSSPRN